MKKQTKQLIEILTHYNEGRCLKCNLLLNFATNADFFSCSKCFRTGNISTDLYEEIKKYIRKRKREERLKRKQEAQQNDIQ